jgi:hypothetical protein
LHRLGARPVRELPIDTAGANVIERYTLELVEKLAALDPCGDRPA